MNVVYLDYNVVASIAGVPSQPDAGKELAALQVLQRQGLRFALSAWTAYELARSNDEEHRRRCCDFVDTLNALWVSDARYVLRRELARFLLLDNSGGQPAGIAPIRALNTTMGQMWSTYGIHVAGDQTFRDCVQSLRSDPKNIETIVNAATVAQQSIVVAREAHADGRAVRLQPTVDRQVFAHRLSCDVVDPRIDHLMANQVTLYRDSPMLAIEDALSSVRARDSFVPKVSHAADLQHAMAPLAYCDALVTRDRQLAEHCRIVIRDLNLARGIYAHIRDVPTH